MRCFIDTNVLIYTQASDEPRKQRAALELLRQLFQAPAKHLVMGVGVEQSQRSANGDVIRSGSIDSVAQKLPQAQ